MLKIISAPNPVLSQCAKPVTVRYLAKRISKVGSHIRKIIGEMEKALLSAKDPVGVGLAAPQVGKSLQIFIAKPTLKSEIQVFINPSIEKINADQKQINTGKSPRKSVVSAKIKSASTKLEGCLSLPNIWGEVKREPEITVSYLDGKENLSTRKFNGFMATIIQHEMDHLQGILFTKRVLEQQGTLYKSHKNEKGEDIFEEIEI